MPSVEDGRQLFDNSRQHAVSAATTRTAVGRGRLAFIAEGRTTRETPEGRDARAKLRAHFAKPKNDDGSDFAAEFADNHQPPPTPGPGPDAQE